jgi:hypothetical protein
MIREPLAIPLDTLRISGRIRGLGQGTEALWTGCNTTDNLDNSTRLL